MKAMPQDAAAAPAPLESELPLNRRKPFMQLPPAIKSATQYDLLAKADGEAPITSAFRPLSFETPKSYRVHRVVI
jgi:hypothetical protein